MQMFVGERLMPKFIKPFKGFDQSSAWVQSLGEFADDHLNI